MKLTNLAACFALILMICSAPVVAQHTTSPASAARSPEVVLREFYKWYIHAECHQIDPFKGKARTTLKKYVTVRFFREIDRNEKLPEGQGFDADYFLQTQEYPASPDVEADWTNISVSQVAVKGTTATATVSFGKKEDLLDRVRVTLIQEGGVWKISRVKVAS